MDWAEAEAHCWYTYGAHLASINSAAENEFVAYMTAGKYEGVSKSSLKSYYAKTHIPPTFY